jgi:hypothetical protein
LQRPRLLPLLVCFISAQYPRSILISLSNTIQGRFYFCQYVVKDPGSQNQTLTLIMKWINDKGSRNNGAASVLRGKTGVLRIKDTLPGVVDASS